MGGTFAIFDAIGSPITQSFGLGLFSPASEAELATLEAFFLDRGADINHEVRPLGDPALMALLSAQRDHALLN